MEDLVKVRNRICVYISQSDRVIQKVDRTVWVKMVFSGEILNVTCVYAPRVEEEALKR